MMAMCARRKCRVLGWRQYGLGLPETLIAFALMMVALTGLLAAHQQSKLLQRDASQRLQAVLALRELSLRWQLNVAAAPSYRSSLAAGFSNAGSQFSCSQASCSGSARAQADVAWTAAALKGLSRAQWHIQPCHQWLADCLWLGWGSQADACDGRREPLRFERCLQWLLPP